jgi:hypothetical protein
VAATEKLVPAGAVTVALLGWVLMIGAEQLLLTVRVAALVVTELLLQGLALETIHRY